MLWRADSRPRLLALHISHSPYTLLTSLDVARRVRAMKRTKMFGPASSGSNSSWRTLNWLARNCLDFLFYIGLAKQEVLEMLSQVHRDLETSRWATKRGSMNRHTSQWTGPKMKNRPRPVLQWCVRRVVTTKEPAKQLGFQPGNRAGLYRHLL